MRGSIIPARRAMSVRATSATERPVVAVYREVLLYYNEPYIRTQAEAVPRYTSVYVGTRRAAHTVELPPERTLVFRDHYQRVDGALDRVLKRLPARGALRALATGSVLARAGESLFLRTGVSPYLERCLRELRPAILHAHTGVSGAHALPLARRLGIPFVVTFHGYDAGASDAELARWPLRGRIFLRRRDAMKRECARVIAVSGYTRDLLLANGWPAERVIVHYMGVDTALFRPDPAAAPLCDREPLVFFAGRLVEKKGLEFLIEAMGSVAARFPNAELVIAGRGERLAALERRAAEARARVRFIGRVTPDEVRQWLARARLYCMPSVRAADGDAEGLPTALLEAMASGLPVMATTHAGVPEAVRHGETGLLAPERDARALAEHLLVLLGNPVLCERMGAAARARVLESFDHRRQAARLASIYDEVRAERAASTH
jgi:glycosyltransferase involved in cell wall biosynthesis